MRTCIASLAVLLVSSAAQAVPTERQGAGLTLQDHIDQLPFAGGHADAVPVKVAGFDLDLSEQRLVSFGEDEPPVWITELDKIKAKAEGRRFMDITDTPTLGFSNFMRPSAMVVKYSYPTPGNATDLIKPIIKDLKVDNLKETLTKFTSFRTRYYKSETGRESQQFLLAKLQKYARKSSHVTVSEFPHPWGQNSIIARFSPASEKQAKAPVTIIGAHQDSTNMWPFLPAPGADDDGSGTTSIVEAFRALVDAGFKPEAPVEFHWYSAEEGGLLGSQAVAQDYERRGVKVLAMSQFDMTAWVKQGTEEVIGVITDFVDTALTDFIASLIKKYLSIPPKPTKCGYACSDHASFSKAGYQSAFSIESTFEDSNKNIHSTGDTINHPEFSFTHMLEFSKLAVAFAIELGGWEHK